jgi:hypothetical protein
MRRRQNAHRILDVNSGRNTVLGRNENADTKHNFKTDPTAVCGLDSFSLGHPWFSNRYRSQRQHKFKILENSKTLNS